MEIIKSMHIALLAAFLFAAGGIPAWPQALQQTGNQHQTDTSAAKKDKKTEKAGPNTSASQSAPDLATAPLKKSASKQSDAADKGATAASSTAPVSSPQPLGKRLRQKPLAWCG
jgi:hypothetical protein